MSKSMRLKIILLSLFSLIALSLSIFFISSMPSRNKDIPDSLAFYTYNITSSINDLVENYLSKSTFIIDTSEGFATLIDFLSRPQIAFPEDQPSAGPDQSGSGIFRDNTYFEGKTVVLNRDITTSAGAMTEFKGTFDGQGHTITYNNRSEVASGIFGRFCSKLSVGTIQNLCVTDVKYSVTESGSDDTYVAAIVGENSGSVISCIVNNIDVNSYRYKKHLAVSTIAAQNKGTINCCLVQGNYNINSMENNTFLTNADGACCFYFSVNSGTITNSIYAASFIKSANGNHSTDHIVAPDGDFNNNNNFRSGADSLGESNYNGFSSGYSSMSSTCSSTTTGISYTDLWYKYPTNKGFNCDNAKPIYLRAFISWVKWSFEVEENTYGWSIDKSEVWVPEEYQDDITAVENVVTIYDTTVTATPKKDFETWDIDADSRKYTAKFKPAVFTISFDLSSVSDKVLITTRYGGVESSKQSFEVNVEAQINASIFGNLEKGVMQYCEFTFTDKNGTDVYVKVEINDSRFYISNYICDGETYNTARVWNGVNKDMTFGASAVLKTYDVEFV